MPKNKEPYLNSKSFWRLSEAFFMGELFLSKDSFQNDNYPNLSDAMHHYKDTKEGVIEVCASIESYAIDRSVDTAIETCLLLNQSKDVILKVVKKQFPEYDDEKISSRISFLWNQKESE